MEGKAKTIVVVEDDGPTAAFLTDNLRADGYRVLCAGGARDALRLVEVARPDLVLLDLGLESGSGLEVLDRVRSSGGVSEVDPELPVIVLTGRASELDRVRGFARGADDYVCKPFSYPELVARVVAVLRRAAGRRGSGGVLRVGELTVDPATRSVRLAGRPVRLSAKEFALLHALAVEPLRVVPKAELLRDVWGYASAGKTRTIDAHACRLRRKLAGGSERYVVNARGVGYRLLEGPR